MARSVTQIRIVLGLEERLGKACRRLVHPDDRSGVRISHSICSEGKWIVNFNGSAIENRQHIRAMR